MDKVKETKILEFNNKRSCGLWLLLVGTVLLFSIILGGKFIVNPITFLAGYYISFYIANINKKVRRKFSDGPASPFQIKMIFGSIALLFILMFLIAGPFIPKWDWRMIWLGVNLATGIHFLPFYYVHGKTMIILGILCTITAIAGYTLTTIPVTIIITADSLLKIAFGVQMMFFSQPTQTAF